MEVKVWSYLKEYEQEKSEVMEAVDEVLSSGVLILGEQVKNFENSFSSYCQSTYGVGVNSATDALFFALKALGIKEGDEVLTVANTAVPTVSAIGATGASARFVDIDPVTYLMDVSKVEQAITSTTKCIIAVQLFGQCVDMDPLIKIASSRGIPILEDCAQSHGAQYKGRVSGSLTDISAFSFYPTKILGGYGDGGMVVTGSEELYSKLKRLRFYGMEKTYYSVDEGYNSRLDEIHAAILLKKMNHIDEYIQRRRQIADVYNKRLASTSLILPAVGAGNVHSYYLYVVRHQQRDEIMEALKSRGIFLNISYPWPIHIMSGYKHLGYSEGDLPNTEKAAKEIFSLPMYPSLTDEEQNYVVEALLDILK